MGENIEKVFKDFIRNTPKNVKPDFNIGDKVESYTYTMEYSINKLKVNTSEKAVKYEIIKKHSSDKYDIQMIDKPDDVEKNVDGKYLFPSVES